LARLGRAPFGVYIHVPFCRVRCGYCDFNTYTASELGAQPGASRTTYAAAAISEIRMARRILGDVTLPVGTVFFGGGTPTLLPPDHLISILGAVRSEFGLAPNAEITTESNPDSVTRRDLDQLRAGGVNRISFGVQSVQPHVLAVLDRTHDPARVPHVVSDARASGFDSVSVDLIYGTPGESLADWERSVEAAIALQPDHVSAYALIVEEGTALARRVRRGDVAATDDDDAADKYERADAMLSAAGFEWYEVSNWAKTGAACRHNLNYWRGADWWGIGPGAHSHVGGVRWWNVKHPAAYAARLTDGHSPAAGREVLDDDTRRTERVLLETRLSSGLSLDALDTAGHEAVADLVARGLVEAPASESYRGGAWPRTRPQSLVLTRKGRLMADAVVRELVA
jgi:oxygen-independent coproporphyrinogen-3 oxidase